MDFCHLSGIIHSSLFPLATVVSYFVIGCLLIAAKHAKLSDRTANDMFFMFLLTGIYFFTDFSTVLLYKEPSMFA